MVSIIIPAYNAEKTINRTLYSILRQTYKDFECLVICNSCTDKTYRLSKNFENFDNRFKVFNFSWRGVSKSRNKGIDLSKGEFIMFIDADDYIDNYYIEKMISAQNMSKSKLVRSKINVHYFDKKSQWGLSEYGFITLNNELLFKNVLYDVGHTPVYLYDRDLIADIRFNENIEMGEDLMFNMEMIMKNGELYSTDICGYNYSRYNSKLSLKNCDVNEVLRHYNELENKYGVNNIFRNFIENIFIKKHNKKD